MSKESEPKPAKEKLSKFTKKVIGWAILIGGVAVGLQWILGATAGI